MSLNVTSNFAKAMNASTRTWNGATSLVTPDTSGRVAGRMKLFFKCVQGLNVPMLYNYLRESANESVFDTFVLVFNIRDCRGGKGLRELGRKSMVWLFLNYPAEFEKVMGMIPEYGRWDDYLYFFPGVLDLRNKSHVVTNFNSTIPSNKYLDNLRDYQHVIVSHFGDQLRDDVKRMNEGLSCSLAAKWSPTERDSLDVQHGVYGIMTDVMGVSRRDLRRDYNTPLRSYLNVVERFICEGKWDHVDYNKVPGHAMKKLRKAFEKHDTERFQEWRQSLNKTTKVNAKTLHPHEIVRSFCSGIDDVLEAQWRVIVDEVRKLGTMEDTVVVCDTSASMNGLPLYIAVSMGMIISEIVDGPFHNHVITFNTTPQFVRIKDGTAYDRFNQIRSIPWGGSTNLQKTFELILNRGRECGLRNEDMPKRLFIISDMQFNIVEGYSTSKTNFEVIEKMYRDSEYTRPQIVFWNVNGSSTDFPVTVDDDGTALVSGSSPAILKSIMNTRKFNPESIMRGVIDDERYQSIRDALA